VHRESIPPGQAIRRAIIEFPEFDIDGLVRREFVPPGQAIRSAIKKFPEFFDKDGPVHRESVPPGQSVTVPVLQRKRRDKLQAGAVVSAPSHTSTSHRTLRISLPVTFGCSLLSKWASRGHQMECEGRVPEDSNRSLQPVLPAVAGSVEPACVCVQGPYCEGG
jgi:hypothetical protein